VAIVAGHAVRAAVADVRRRLLPAEEPVVTRVAKLGADI
jgi:hypothetical protein